MKISLNIQIDKFVHRSDLETIILESFPSEKLSYTVINLYSQELLNLTIAKLTTSTKTSNTLKTSVKELRAITMCRTYTPDCQYDNSIIELFANVYCPNTMCSGNFCKHEKTVQSLERSDHQCLQDQSMCQVRNFPFEEQINSFFLMCGQGIYI